MDPLFNYTDYRKYLKDYVALCRSTKRYFSYRTFADNAGFKARDYILRVINGQRNLSRIGVHQLSKAMGLTEKQADYFENLVFFNQSDKTEDKAYFFERMGKFGKSGKQSKLRQDSFDFYATWYHGVIRSLAPVWDFAGDHVKLSKALDPAITPKQARDSLALLVKLGLLEYTSKTRYEVKESQLTTGDEVKSLAVTAYHKTMIELASRAIDKTLPQERDIGSVTMSLSQRGFDAVKSEMQQFRKRVMDIATADTAEDRVCQLGLQLFPVARIKELQ